MLKSKDGDVKKQIDNNGKAITNKSYNVDLEA